MKLDHLARATAFPAEKMARQTWLGPAIAYIGDDPDRELRRSASHTNFESIRLRPCFLANCDADVGFYYSNTSPNVKINIQYEDPIQRDGLANFVPGMFVSVLGQRNLKRPCKRLRARHLDNLEGLSPNGGACPVADLIKAGTTTSPTLSAVVVVLTRTTLYNLQRLVHAACPTPIKGTYMRKE